MFRSPLSAIAAMTGSSCGMPRSAAARAIQRATRSRGASSPGYRAGQGSSKFGAGMPPLCAHPLGTAISASAATAAGTSRRTRRILASADDEAKCSSYRPEVGVAVGHQFAVHVEARAVRHPDLDVRTALVVGARVPGQVAAPQVIGKAHEVEARAGLDRNHLQRAVARVGLL